MLATFEVNNGAPPTRRPPSGICIYCRSTVYREVDGRRLGDEYVIPESLSGTLVLEQAACQFLGQQAMQAAIELCRNLEIEMLPTNVRRWRPLQTHAGRTIATLIENYGTGHATITLRAIVENIRQ